MQKKYLVVFVSLIFLSININLLAFSNARAASDTAVVIQPSKIDVTASPNQKLARSFSVINRSNFDVRLKLVVKDYRQTSDYGKLEFYDSKTDPASVWLVPQFLEIGLKPLETKSIGLVINVPKDFSGGGHYGAIMFQPAGSTNNISSSDFGELVLLNVTGSNIKASAVAKSVAFTTGAIQGGNPVNFNFKIQNTGNTHFITQGRLTMQNWLGKEIGSFNLGQLIVYPNTSRTFQWRWNGTPSFGLYRANLSLVDPSSLSTQKLKLIDSAWFIIFPWQAAFLAVIFGLVVFAIVKYREKIGGLLKSLYKVKSRQNSRSVVR